MTNSLGTSYFMGCVGRWGVPEDDKFSPTEASDLPAEKKSKTKHVLFPTSPSEIPQRPFNLAMANATVTGMTTINSGRYYIQFHISAALPRKWKLN